MNRFLLASAGLLALSVVGCAGTTNPISARSSEAGKETAASIEKGVLQEMVRDGSLTLECAKRSKVGEEVISLSPIDLNRDGTFEYEVSGNPGCACIGARHCAKWIYQRTPDGYRQLLDMVQPDEGIGVRSTRTRGYADLEVVGWAGDEPLREVFRFDGRVYRSTGLTPL